MAKNALLGVLESTIGKYVLDLDAEKLNLGIWSGQVELHNLQLNIPACNAELDRQAAEAPNLAVPLRVVSGSFDSLSLQIPWTHLSSQSVVVEAKGLHVVVQPHNSTSSSSSAASGTDFMQLVVDSEEKRAQHVQQQRIQSLQAAELSRVQTNELMKLKRRFQQNDDDDDSSTDNSNGSSSPSKRDTNNSTSKQQQQQDGFIAKLVKRIVENLQVDIQDIQITILDESTGTAAGMVLGGISFVTTDMAGHRTFVDRTSTVNPNDLLNKFLYKKLTISNWGLFVDDSPTSIVIGSNHNASESKQQQQQQQQQQDQHSYILSPLNFEAKFREADASITHDYPKWLLRSNLPAVNLGLSHKQYQQTMSLLNAMSTSSRSIEGQPLFPQYRPLHRVTKNSAKEWWHYAFKCVSRLNGRRSWVMFYEAFRKRQVYIPLYKRHKHAPGSSSTSKNDKNKNECPWLKPLTPQELSIMQDIEADRTISIEGIMVWRNLADAQVEKEREKHLEQTGGAPQQKKKKTGLFSSLFGGKSDNDNDNDDDYEIPISLSTEEMKQLEDVGIEQIGFGESLSSESKLCAIEFVLGEFSIHLTKAFNQPVLGLEMGKVSIKFESDAGGSFEFAYQLSSLEIMDLLKQQEQQKQDTLFPCIVRSLQGPQAAIKASTPLNEDVFQAQMSKSKTGDSKLTVKLIPFEAVLAPHLVTEVMEFVTLPSPTSSSSPHIIEEFKDGNDGTPNNKEEERNNSNSTPEYTESFSNALVEAWQAKTKDKTSLTIDLDLQAPVLVIPENCFDPYGSVLVLDLGGFRLQYGFLDPDPKITQWFQSNPRNADSYNLSTQSGDSQVTTANTNNTAVVDHGRLELEKMTFLVGQAETWKRITSMRENHMAEQEAIIEPISVRFDFAVESVVSSSIPRACVFAAIPTSNFKVSPNHLFMTLQVYTAWMKTLENIRSSPGSTSTPSTSPSSAAFESGPSDAPNSSTDHEIVTNRAIGGNRNNQGDNGTRDVVNVQVDDVNKAIETTLGKDTSLFTTLYLNMATESYSFVIYDSGDFQNTKYFNVKNSHSNSASPLIGVAEGLVLSGGVQLTVELATDRNGGTSSIETEIKGQNFEVYSGFGKELRRPLQILEPVTGTLNIGLVSQGVKTKKTQLKARILDVIDASFSMRTLTLINTISTEVSERLATGLEADEDTTSASSRKSLDEEKTHRIEAMANALENQEGSFAIPSNPNQSAERSKNVVTTDRASSSIICVNIKVPETKLTIINDLQGLDEALFRVDVQQFVAKCMIATMQDLDNSVPTQTVFDVKIHTKILADYFDPSVNTWKYLLKAPWELDFKSERAPDRTSKSGRFRTRADIHFMPLHLSFSEHFLIGLASANRMFAMSNELENEAKSTMDASSRKSSNSSTRNLVTALPYALDNFSGLDVEYLLAESRIGNRKCPNGVKQYFRFNPPRGNGRGGKRQYGQDATNDLSVKLFVGENTIEVKRLDDELGRPKRCHILNDGSMVVTTVVKEGKSTVLRLSSNFYLQNRTPVPVRVNAVFERHEYEVGVCKSTSSLVESTQQNLVPYDLKEGTLSKESRRMGVRFSNMSKLVKTWTETKKGQLTLRFYPDFGAGAESSNIYGDLVVETKHERMSQAENHTIRFRSDVLCGPGGKVDETVDTFVFQASVKLQLIGDLKLVSSFILEPRAQLVNTMPVHIAVLSGGGYVFSSNMPNNPPTKVKVHQLAPGRKMEIFSPGNTLPVKIRCSEQPLKGTPTGITSEWIQIPFSGLDTPLMSFFPFAIEESHSFSTTLGNEFFIAEANNYLPDFFLERINDDTRKDESRDFKNPKRVGPPTYLITVGNYGVDHTRNILFEQLVSKSKRLFKAASTKKSFPMSSFGEQDRGQTISLLPTAEIPIRIIQRGPSQKELTSATFRIEELSMTEGGAQATPLLWANGSESGYYAYRKLVSSFQSELHVIPEFLVFNGSKSHHVTVKQQSCPNVVKIGPNETAPVFISNRDKGLPLSFHYDDIGGATKVLRLEELGIHIELVRTSHGNSLGSLAIQTSLGSSDSRLLIKLSEVGQIEQEKPKNPVDLLPGFVDDNMRLRVHAEQFSVTLNQAKAINGDSDGVGILEHAGGTPETSSLSKSPLPKHKNRSNTRHSNFPSTESPICTIILKNAVYDIQKLFKEKQELLGESDVPERCQLSFIVHDFKIMDETPNSPFPIVFGYTGENRFLDFCVRTKGPQYANTVKIDLYDLVLAHPGKSEKSDGYFFFQTSEEFVWKLIDTADLIVNASEDGAESDTDKDCLDRVFAAHVPEYIKTTEPVHTPPQVATIYDIAKARVSPFTIVVSFKRTPQAERYEKFINNQGANLMRYFTQQLKFTVDHCNLHFARYEETHIKGPMDRVREIFTAVYISRMKLKAVQILAAASFGDWKSLSARDDGDDEFVDGDLLRVSGTLAGNSVAFAFNKVGRGIGKGVTVGFEAIGGGIENGASLLGAKTFGLKANQAVAGVGGAVGGTLQGVGEGTGKVFQEAGKGLGHLFGGISGGGSKIAKGIGKGIVTGDGSAVASGFREGVGHIGKGFQSSVKAVGSGVGGGVSSVVRGSVAGVKASTKGNKKEEDGLAKLRREFEQSDFS